MGHTYIVEQLNPDGRIRKSEANDVDLVTHSDIAPGYIDLFDAADASTVPSATSSASTASRTRTTTRRSRSPSTAATSLASSSAPGPTRGAADSPPALTRLTTGRASS